MEASPTPPEDRRPPVARPPARSLALGILLAVVLVALALVLTRALLPYLTRTVLIFFIAAVLVTAWAAGRFPALLATVLSIVAAESFVFGQSLLESPSPGRLLRLGLFAAIGLSSSAFFGRLREARAVAELRAREAEELAGRLSDQAAELEAQVAESESLTNELEQANLQLVVRSEAVQRAAERARRLHEVAGALLNALTPAQVADTVIGRALEAAEAEAGLIGVVTADQREFRILSARGYPQELLEQWTPLVLDAQTPITAALRTGEPVWIADQGERTRGYPDVAARDAATPNSAWAVLPLMVRDRSLGAIALSFRRAGAFAEEDRTFLLLLAQQCAHALDRARLYEAERTARIRSEFAEHRLTFLASASSALVSSLDHESALGAVARLIVPELADWCLVHVLDPAGMPRTVAAVHADETCVEALRELGRTARSGEAAEIGFHRALRTGRADLIPRLEAGDLEALTGGGADAARQLQQLGAWSLLSVPIRVRDDVLGAITLATGASRRVYTEVELSLAEELAARAGHAIDNARMFETTRRANQAKSDFLAVMSHELRTPLNAVLGYADLVLLGVPEPIPDAARQQIERVRLAARHLLQLVDEVLTFSRIEAGKEVADAEPTQMNALVREAVSLIEPLAQEKHLRTEVRTPDHEVVILTDGWKFRQILNNLLSNAVKFTDGGAITVTLEESGDSLQVHVADTGIGIGSENLDQIFDPFWQVEQSSTRRYGGTGLGLGVARQLAELLGGGLTVTSRPGEGSTFTVRVPARRA